MNEERLILALRAEIKELDRELTGEREVSSWLLERLQQLERRIDDHNHRKIKKTLLPLRKE